MLASETRSLAEEIRPDLLFAGIGIDNGSLADRHYCESFFRQLRETRSGVEGRST